MHSGWWRGAAIYQPYPRSFADANGDGVGDLAGITAHLPYVAALGVDGVWLSPFFTSPMRDFGYDVSDHRGVDPLPLPAPTRPAPPLFSHAGAAIDGPSLVLPAGGVLFARLA